MPRKRQPAPEPAKIPGPIQFSVPGLTPPSVNHYKKPIKVRLRDGSTHNSYALTDEAAAFKQAVHVFARNCHSLSPKTAVEKNRIRYGLHARIFLGAGERLDGDNGWKCLADAIKECGLIHSDARVKDWFLQVDGDDRQNPRTEVTAWIVGAGGFTICAGQQSNSL